MKKTLIFLVIIIFVLALSACDGFPTDDMTIDLTDIISTDEMTTIEVPTSQETTSEITTHPITTIINDDIYLQLNSGQDTVEINSEWIDKGALFIVNDESFEMITEDFVDVSSLGVYTINYTYTYEEDVFEMVRYVIVVDQTAPEIILNLGIDTIRIGDDWIDAGVTMTDNSGEEISVLVSGEVDTSIANTYLITYSATDSSGNTSSIRRYVTVIE